MFFVNHTVQEPNHLNTEYGLFHELILGSDGRIYRSSCFDDITDWSFVYYDGNVYVHQNNSMYCHGVLPEKCCSLPVIAGTTNLCEAHDGGCLMYSECPVLSESTSIFAIFRYENMLGLYMADSMVSERIYLTLMDYTTEDEALYTNVFFGLLRRHDLEAAEALAAWLASHTAPGKEIKA